MYKYYSRKNSFYASYVSVSSRPSKTQRLKYSNIYIYKNNKCLFSYLYIYIHIYIYSFIFLRICTYYTLAYITVALRIQ